MMAKITTNLKQWCSKCLQITATWYDEMNVAHSAGCEKKQRRPKKPVQTETSLF
jgi:hypothetical protein